MIHLLRSQYVRAAPAGLTRVEAPQPLTLDALARYSRKTVSDVSTDQLWALLWSLWDSVLSDASAANLHWLAETTVVDQALKGRDLPGPGDERIPSPCGLALTAADLSFEHVLASYFLYPELASGALLAKVEELSWEQIIQEISVIRMEVNLLLFNRKINLFLPPEHQIDFSEDVELQLCANPLLSWLLDEHYRFSNVQYFKRHVDLATLAHFYDAWMIFRRPAGRSESTEHSLDNLTWITDAIMRGDWEKLLRANLERNFGCVYVDNTMIDRANQVWASALVRDHSRGSSETARRLAAKESLFRS